MLRCGFRKGDNAEMAVLEYVDRDGELRPARPPRAKVDALAAEAAAAAAEGGSGAAAPASLQDRLAAMLQAQSAVKGAIGAGAVPALTPAFPLPHVAPRAWQDSLWAPRSKAAREAIAAGGSPSPLSRLRGSSGSSGPKAEKKAKEPELR